MPSLLVVVVVQRQRAARPHTYSFRAVTANRSCRMLLLRVWVCRASSLAASCRCCVRACPADRQRRCTAPSRQQPQRWELQQRQCRGMSGGSNMEFFKWALVLLTTGWAGPSPHGWSAGPRVLAASDTGPVRDTAYGKVRGVALTLPFLEDRQVERYLGVPFARPPVGPLRFEKPQPPVPWNGVKEVMSLPKACLQTSWELNYVRSHYPDFKREDMDEDCLYLNLYVPVLTVSGGGGLPVLVHVHGGSNEVGMGGMLHADVLAALGQVIVITFNYRLGAFGFLSGESKDFPGNYGLHDQTMALVWVAKNIHFFGGDPSKVTIQGHSAGGTDVGQHVLSPLSKGLFRYAIMQSGSPLAYWALLHPPATTLESTKAFVKSLGCTSTHDMALVKECLKKTDAEYINNAQYKHVLGLYNYSPVVDGEFIVDAPEEVLQNLSLNGQSFMTGITRDEGSLTTDVVLKSAEKSNQHFRFDENYPKDYTPPPVHAFSMIPGIEHLVFHEYKPWHDPDNKTANMVGFSHVVGDSTFVAPAIKIARLLSRRFQKVFFYTFNHVSALSSHPLWMGVPHGIDLFYLFGCPMSGHPLHRYNDLDRNVSRTFIDLWSNFVKRGYPFLSSSPKESFPAFDDRNQSYFIVDNDGTRADIRFGRRLRSRQMAFWNNLLPKLRRKEAAPGASGQGNAVTWVFVALSTLLLVIVVILSLCVLYFKKLARDRCVVHANDEKAIS